jgi:hypothetical protein
MKKVMQWTVASTGQFRGSIYTTDRNGTSWCVGSSQTETTIAYMKVGMKMYTAYRNGGRKALTFPSYRKAMIHVEQVLAAN